MFTFFVFVPFHFSNIENELLQSWRAEGWGYDEAKLCRAWHPKAAGGIQGQGKKAAGRPAKHARHQRWLFANGHWIVAIADKYLKAFKVCRAMPLQTLDKKT